jgi:hypothetical protein
MWFQKYPYFNALFNCCPRVEGEGIFGRMVGISTEMLLHFSSLTHAPEFFRKCPLQLLPWGMRVRAFLEEWRCRVRKKGVAHRD